MKIILPGEEARKVFEGVNNLIGAGVRLMTAAASKLSSQTEYIDRTTDVSDDELARGKEVVKQEFLNRERRARIEALELDAREMLAVANKIDASIKQKSAEIRQSNINRSMHHKPKSQPQTKSPSNGIPPNSLPPLKAQPAVQERSSAVVGGNEGKSLTQNLGDKLKAASPS